jgi:plastocyanin
MHSKRPSFPVGAVLLLAACMLSPVFAADVGRVRVEVRDNKGAPVPDAVASLHPLDRPATVTPPAEPAVIVQDKEEFRPYVTAVVTGTRIRFPNQDKVQHHVFSLSKAKTFDIPLYRGEPKEPVLFDQPGIVSLGCDIHDWMSAYVLVLSTPHFVKTAEDGIASLADLPAGRYRLEVWHPRLKAPDQREVALRAADTATKVVSVTLGFDRRISRNPESGGGAYK